MDLSEQLKKLQRYAGGARILPEDETLVRDAYFGGLVEYCGLGEKAVLNDTGLWATGTPLYKLVLAKGKRLLLNWENRKREGLSNLEMDKIFARAK